MMEQGEEATKGVELLQTRKQPPPSKAPRVSLYNCLLVFPQPDISQKAAEEEKNHFKSLFKLASFSSSFSRSF